MRVPTRRVAIAVALGGLALAWALFGWGGGGDGTPRYVTEQVARGPITAVVAATGTVNPVTTVQVGTYVSGPIEEIAVDFNSPVERGQLLARIDPRPFQVKVDAARAELANARASLEKDRASAALKTVTLRRVRDLNERGIVSQSELDVAVSEDRQARAQVALGQAGVQNAEARLQEAEVNLAYTTIVSPVDGVVVSRNVDVGQTVAASFQTPTLFLVAEDLTKMQVAASVSEADIGGVAPGQSAAFTVDAYPGATFHGRVAQVRSAPVVVQNVVTYDVVISVGNADLRLKPGMTANVTIVTATREDALRVRNSALRFRPPAAADGTAEAAEALAGGAGRVWVLDGRRPRPVTVETGLADDGFTEIVAGLDEGTGVIVALERPAPSAPALQHPFAPRRR